jgi:hypothetical protein
MDSALETEWDTGDLYEKRRVKSRRRWVLLLSAVFLTFLGLCSVPVIQERSPKWKTLQAARRLAVQIEQLKTLAIQKKKAMHLRWSEQGELVLLESAHCSAPVAPVTPGAPVSDTSGGGSTDVPQIVEKKSWIDPARVHGLLGAEASALDLRWVIDKICFDPVYGLQFEAEQSRAIFVLVPVKDLTDKRLDRASYVVMDGSSAKISIN